MSKKSNPAKKKSSSKKSKLDFLNKHPLVVPVTSFFAVIFFGLFLWLIVGGTTQGATDNRIVNVYVDGESKTLSTRAKTVGELLERLEIDLIPEDIVEPAQDTLIFEDNTQVNVYRARPVSVIDGDRVLTIITAQRAPRLVASEAGLEIIPEDEVRFGRSEEGVIGGANEVLVIDRAEQVQLSIYGVLTSVWTTEDTVGDFMDSIGIQLAEGETLEPGREQEVENGLLISVNREGIKTVAETEVIEFETEYEEDNSITVGQSQVKVEGVNGERATIYEVEEDDEGNEISRKKLQSIVTLKPKTKVVLLGAKPATLSSSVNVSGEKAELMAAAGIAESDYAYVDFIVQKESTWRPGAVNSSSGAYGLCQSYPASKMASAGSDYLTNPVTQLRWCAGYAKGRYGSWQGAYNAWLAQGWW